jgi:cysteine desulfurase
VYLDNQSSTKLDERVLESMMLFFTEYYGNPQSVYYLGSISKDALEKARRQVAKLINATPEEIIFTSCGTESNNLAIKGIANGFKFRGNHIIVSSIEHFSILSSVKRLKREGFDVSFVSVDANGRIDKYELKKMLRKDTILISIQHANPEVGTIQDIKELVSMVKKSGAEGSSIAFHTDAVGACGVIKVDVEDLGIDALTLSSSVMYGPKGSAALYIRNGIKINPQMDGGIQEKSIRSGTENLPSIVGFGKACEIVKEEIIKNSEFVKRLGDKLISELPKKLDYVYLNGARENRLPGNVNFSVEFIEGEALFLLLDAIGIMAASGSACASRNLRRSHVLAAMGIDALIAQGSVIFTLSKFNTESDINYVLEELPKVVKKLREISPLYSYFKKTGKRKLIEACDRCYN